MSEMKLCQGPLCHTHKTKDRIRGPKGYKQYETRKRSSFPYHDEFCSMMCLDEWFRMHGQRAIDRFGRTTEPQCVMADSAWYKDSKWQGYNNDNNSTTYLHYFVNDLLGQRIPITEQQYDDQNLTTPTT